MLSLGTRAVEEKDPHERSTAPRGSDQVAGCPQNRGDTAWEVGAWAAEQAEQEIRQLRDLASGSEPKQMEESVHEKGRWGRGKIS